MAIKFKGEFLFGQSPAHVLVGPGGVSVLVNARVNPFQAGSQPIGPLEATLTVTGRLITDGKSELSDLLAAIHAELTNPPQVGAVTDDLGNTWDDMSFVRFEPLTPVLHGRQVTLPYSAQFIRFAPI